MQLNENTYFNVCQKSEKIKNIKLTKKNMLSQMFYDTYIKSDTNC